MKMEIKKEKTSAKSLHLSWKIAIALSGIILIIIVWGYIIYRWQFSYLTDWQCNYFPAVHDLLQGNTPYGNHSTFNPFWTYILLIPFALLPPVLGEVAIGITCIISFAFVGYKLGAKPLSLALLLFSPQLLFLSRNGGIDWMIALGFIMPPQIGLFFVLIKPQIGICVAIFWFFEAWEKDKIKEVIRVFAPVCTGYVIGYILFGTDAIWRGSEFIGSNLEWDATTFPLTIPVGLVLLISAIRSHNIKLAIPASPFLAPYIAFYSWPAALLGLADNTWLLTIAVIGMWIIAIITGQY